MLGFRVWATNLSKFINPEDYLLLMDFKGFLVENENVEYYKYNAASDRFIPMQSTGIKDVNAKEIFEGDVLLIRYRGTNHEQRMVVDDVVEFVQYEYTCAEYSGVESLEIIGNKWENPELLEKTSC